MSGGDKTASSDEILDYAELVKVYTENLDSTLRGFGLPVECLETWVPDADTVKSLLSLVEGVQISGQDEVRVFLSRSVIDGLDLAALTEQSSQWGEVRIEPNELGLTFSVSEMTDTAAFGVVHRAYRIALRQASRISQFEGTINAEPGLVAIEVAEAHLRLGALVEPESHRIQEIAHRGAQSAVEHGLLETLCRILSGTTVQEASDHGVIYVEHELRDPELLPVPGIVTAENSGSSFAPVTRLTRQLLERYREVTGYNDVQNFFTRQPSPKWLALSTEDKIHKINVVIQELHSGPSTLPREIRAVKVSDDVKVTLQLPDQLDDGQKQAHLLQIERVLNSKIDDRINVFLEEMKDSNSIRRL